MPWNDDPALRDLAAYADKHNLPIVILIGVKQDGGTYQLTSYGRTPALCKAAQALADDIRLKWIECEDQTDGIKAPENSKAQTP